MTTHASNMMIYVMLGLVESPSLAGLALTHINRFDSPNQLHPMYTYSDQKGYKKYRARRAWKSNPTVKKVKANMANCEMDVDCLEDLRLHIKSCHPAQYPGEMWRILEETSDVMLQT
jgi:hypothetical protein